MAHYRLYYMAEDTTRIRGFEAIEAEDDVSALLGVQERQRSVAMELWCANRMVKRWSLIPAPDGAQLSNAATVEAQDGLSVRLSRSA